MNSFKAGNLWSRFLSGRKHERSHARRRRRKTVARHLTLWIILVPQGMSEPVAGRDPAAWSGLTSLPNPEKICNLRGPIAVTLNESPPKMKAKLLLAALTISVSQAVPPTLQTGIPAFLDTDGDGTISEAERQAFAESRAAARQSGGARNWDTNGDGTVDEEERLAAVAALKARLETKLASLFLDLAGDDSVLTLEEFSTLPQFKNVPPQTAANLFNLLDADDDGFVTVGEFFKGIGRGKPPTSPPNSP